LKETIDRTIRVRSAYATDIEDLRRWKNAHREGFFFKEDITPEMQDRWYREYLLRDDDHMLVVSVEWVNVGCLGFRLRDGVVDVYNVILGDARYGEKGIMTFALSVLLEEAGRLYPGKPVTALVLKDNPAVQWYLRRGFLVEKDNEDHYRMLWREK